MTKWYLKCEKCGEIRILDVGFNLYEMKQLYIFCKNCRENTVHRVLKHE